MSSPFLLAIYEEGLKCMCAQCPEVVLCGFIGISSAIAIYLGYLDDKKTNLSTNKPYKDFYTVYR